jgi:hypothetical protein
VQITLASGGAHKNGKRHPDEVPDVVVVHSRNFGDKVEPLGFPDYTLGDGLVSVL